MKNFNWGHGIVLAMLAFIIFILSMIFLFPNGQKNSELVTDNYYEEELQYQSVIDAKKRADSLSYKPEFKQNTEGFTIKFPQDINNSNTKIKFYLSRTDDENLDIKKEIELNEDNAFLIPAKFLIKGNYTLKLMWEKNQKKYQIDYDVIWK